MTALEEVRTVRLLTDVREKLTAWETELRALPEGIGTAVAEALEADAQHQQAHVQALHQEHAAWRGVQERHVATLSTATDLLHRLVALNEGLVRRYRGGLYRRVLLFVGGVLVGVAIMGGACVSTMRAMLAPALHDPPAADTRTAAPAHHVPRCQCGASPWRHV